MIGTIFVQFPAFPFHVLNSLICWLDDICKLYKQLTKESWILLWSSSLFSTSTDAAVNPPLLLTWVKLNKPLSDKFKCFYYQLSTENIIALQLKLPICALPCLCYQNKVKKCSDLSDIYKVHLWQYLDDSLTMTVNWQPAVVHVDVHWNIVAKRRQVSKENISLALSYWLARYLGIFCAYVLVWLAYKLV